MHHKKKIQDQEKEGDFDFEQEEKSKSHSQSHVEKGILQLNLTRLTRFASFG